MPCNTKSGFENSSRCDDIKIKDEIDTEDSPSLSPSNFTSDNPVSSQCPIIVLKGMIWQESVEAGFVTVNVVHRGKTYIGTLMDITKNGLDFCPPRPVSESFLQEENSLDSGRGFTRSRRGFRRNRTLAQNSRRNKRLQRRTVVSLCGEQKPSRLETECPNDESNEYSFKNKRPKLEVSGESTEEDDLSPSNAVGNDVVGLVKKGEEVGPLCHSIPCPLKNCGVSMRIDVEKCILQHYNADHRDCGVDVGVLLAMENILHQVCTGSVQSRMSFVDSDTFTVPITTCDASVNTDSFSAEKDDRTLSSSHSSVHLAPSNPQPLVFSNFAHVSPSQTPAPDMSLPCLNSQSNEYGDWDSIALGNCNLKRNRKKKVSPHSFEKAQALQECDLLTLGTSKRTFPDVTSRVVTDVRVMPQRISEVSMRLSDGGTISVGPENVSCTVNAPTVSLSIADPGTLVGSAAEDFTSGKGCGSPKHPQSKFPTVVGTGKKYLDTSLPKDNQVLIGSQDCNSSYNNYFEDISDDENLVDEESRHSVGSSLGLSGGKEKVEAVESLSSSIFSVDHAVELTSSIQQPVSLSTPTSTRLKSSVDSNKSSSFHISTSPSSIFSKPRAVVQVAPQQRVGDTSGAVKNLFPVSSSETTSESGSSDFSPKFSLGSYLGYNLSGGPPFLNSHTNTSVVDSNLKTASGVLDNQPFECTGLSSEFPLKSSCASSGISVSSSANITTSSMTPQIHHHYHLDPTAVALMTFQNPAAAAVLQHQMVAANLFPNVSPRTSVSTHNTR